MFNTVWLFLASNVSKLFHFAQSHSVLFLIGFLVFIVMWLLCGVCAVKIYDLGEWFINRFPKLDLQVGIEPLRFFKYGGYGNNAKRADVVPWGILAFAYSLFDVFPRLIYRSLLLIAGVDVNNLRRNRGWGIVG